MGDSLSYPSSSLAHDHWQTLNKFNSFLRTESDPETIDRFVWTQIFLCGSIYLDSDSCGRYLLKTSKLWLAKTFLSLLPLHSIPNGPILTNKKPYKSVTKISGRIIRFKILKLLRWNNFTFDCIGLIICYKIINIFCDWRNSLKVMM